MSFLSGRTSLTSVQTSDLVDNSVTLAKLAGGTDGNLITYDTSGDPAAVAVGSSTHVLTSNGAGAAPTFQAASKGITSITNTACTATTHIDFTGFASGTYDNYEIWISNGQPGNDGVVLEMETSTDGGSSYDVGTSDYTWAGSANTEAGAVNDGADPDDSEIQLMSTQAVGNAANENVSARISIFMPETTEFTAFTWSTVSRQNDASLQTSTGGGERQSAADVDGIRLHWSSGDWVEQGKIQFLGIKN